MKLTNWFLNFDFATRARRSHMWANWAAWLVVWIVLFGLMGGVGGLTNSGADAAKPAALVGIVTLVLIVASSIDGIAMTFRRAHDTGRTGWIWLLLLIPLINLLPLYWLLIEDSQQGPNKYGPPVKQFYQPGAA